MPRRRPGRLRDPATGRTATAPGLPERTAEALDRLDEPDLNPASVAAALAEWRQVVALPGRVLGAPHNDWTELVGPSARAELEQAVRVLPRRSTGSPRAELALLDARFEEKTSQNPFADPRLPWWARRWWH